MPNFIRKTSTNQRSQNIDHFVLQLWKITFPSFFGLNMRSSVIGGKNFATSEYSYDSCVPGIHEEFSSPPIGLDHKLPQVVNFMCECNYYTITTPDVKER